MAFYYRNRKVTNTHINPHIIISSPKLKLLILFGEGLTLCLASTEVLVMFCFSWGAFTVENILNDASTYKVPQRVDAFAWHFLTLPPHLSTVVLRCQVHCIQQVHLHIFSCSLILLYQFLLFNSTEPFRHLFSLCFLLKTWPSLIKIPWHWVDHGVPPTEVP